MQISGFWFRILFGCVAALGAGLAPAVAAPEEPNERLMIAELKDNETAVIDYYSVTGTRTIGRTYFIRGGDVKLVTAHRNIIEIKNRTPHIVNKQLLGDLALSGDEVLGLDSLLVFYSARIPGNCGVRDTIQLEFYRDGKRVGKFTYQDDTCFTTLKDEETTRARTRGKVNDLVMDSLVSFRELDNRIRAAEAAREN